METEQITEQQTEQKNNTVKQRGFNPSAILAFLIPVIIILVVLKPFPVQIENKTDREIIPDFISITNLEAVRKGGVVTVTGTFTVTDSGFYGGWPTINVAFYDKNGAVIDYSSDQISALRAYEKWNFTVTFPDSKSEVEYFKITGISLM